MGWSGSEGLCGIIQNNVHPLLCHAALYKHITVTIIQLNNMTLNKSLFLVKLHKCEAKTELMGYVAFFR